MLLELRVMLAGLAVGGVHCTVSRCSPLLFSSRLSSSYLFSLLWSPSAPATLSILLHASSTVGRSFTWGCESVSA